MRGVVLPVQADQRRCRWRKPEDGLPEVDEILTSLAEACRAALQDYTGTVAAIAVQRIFIVAEHSLGFIEDAYGFAQEYEIWHHE